MQKILARIRLSIVSIILLFLGTILPAYSQDPSAIPIQYGDTLRGNLASPTDFEGGSDFDTYVFAGEQGDVVSIRLLYGLLSSESAIWELQIYLPDGTTIDPQNGFEEITLSNYTLPTTGNYALIVIAQSGSAFDAPYAIELEAVSTASGPSAMMQDLANYRLVFTTNANEEGERDRFSMVMVNADGSDYQRITTPPRVGEVLAICPSWSPDGERFIYARADNDVQFVIPGVFTSTLGYSNLQILPADGSFNRPIPLFRPDEEILDYDPEWSPDGTQIAFESNRATHIRHTSNVEDGFDIYVVNADGTDLRQLTHSPSGERHIMPTWSPDGTQIAFILVKDDEYRLYVMNVDGSEMRQLTEIDSWSPDWSPDGNYIAFSSIDDGNDDIYLITADGSELANLTNDAQGTNLRPAWSPDGNYLAFESDIRNPGAQRAIQIMDMQTGERVQIMNNNTRNSCPTWSPLVGQDIPAYTGTIPEITLERGGVINFGEVVTGATGGYGDLVIQEDSGFEDLWIFEVENSGQITIEVRSPDMRVRLFLMKWESSEPIPVDIQTVISQQSNLEELIDTFEQASDHEIPAETTQGTSIGESTRIVATLEAGTYVIRVRGLSSEVEYDYVLGLVEGATTATILPVPTEIAENQGTTTENPTPEANVSSVNVPITRNEDWAVVTETFDGVEMVLVPPGCFMMGTTQEQLDYIVSIGGNKKLHTFEQPAHEICFDQPFWIDKYEVSNAQFQQFGGVISTPVQDGTGPEFPVQQAIWFEARDFCESRGGRLPTEAEWEYASRGPDSLIFSWGNEYNNDIFGFSAEAVGSKSASVSWVGAFDMNGNVLEWVSTLSADYPYNAEDGREDPSNTSDERVVRGGSFATEGEFAVSAYRGVQNPARVSYYTGFRCARAYEGIEDIDTSTQQSTTIPTEAVSSAVTPAISTVAPTAVAEILPEGVINLAEEGVSQNSGWTPVIQTFDGVEMVLVPAGCFMMGSTDEQMNYAISLGGQRDWYTDEQLPNERCFDEPFWIDKYEVTNAQFELWHGEASNLSNWTSASQPREMITWFEAQNFCEERGGRLPTESEWEYTVRGPDGLIYPWGNEFSGGNVSYVDNSSNQTADVGTKSDGISWVGAYDLSGNVWEWTATIYQPYPYGIDDPVLNESDNTSPRIVRGGSWLNGAGDMHGANRIWRTPDLAVFDFGFRCMREYEEG